MTERYYLSCSLDIQVRSKKPWVQSQRCHNSDREIWVILAVPCLHDPCVTWVSLQPKSLVLWARSHNPVFQKWERNLRKVLGSSCCWSVYFLEPSCNSIRQKQHFISSRRKSKDGNTNNLAVQDSDLDDVPAHCCVILKSLDKSF